MISTTLFSHKANTTFDHSNLELWAAALSAHHHTQMEMPPLEGVLPPGCKGVLPPTIL